MKSSPVLFVRVVRPTEQSARPLERQQLIYAYVGDLSSPDHALPLPSKETERTAIAHSSRGVGCLL